LLLTLAGAAAGFVLYGSNAGLGVLLGGSVAFLNFLWLKSSMLALTSAVAATEQVPPKPALLLRFLLRYALLAFVGYAIIASSAISAYGVMWGLLLSVPALLIEVIWEIRYALKHGE
jgi:hypothetical protein